MGLIRMWLRLLGFEVRCGGLIGEWCGGVVEEMGDDVGGWGD